MIPPDSRPRRDDATPLLAAAIDIGSNAMRLRIASVGEDGHIKPLFAHREAVRLGADAFSSGVLRDETIARTEEAFDRFRAILNRYPVERLRATGTSALREAANGDRLIDRIRKRFGITIEVIPGEEEGRLIHQAIYQRLPDLRKQRVLLIDVGGGSVEITLCVRGTIVALESFRMGTVRLLNLFHAADDPDAFHHLLHEYIAAMRAKVRQEIAGRRIDCCVGTGGNLETMADLAVSLLERDRNNRLDYAALDQLGERLEALSCAERIERLGLRPDRADVIVPAVLVVKSVMELVGDVPLLVPGVGLAEGVLVDLLAPHLADVTTMKRQAIAWAKSMARRFHADSGQARRVRRAARAFFDQLRPLHRLKKRDRLLLQVAAICHEIGMAVRSDGHQRHAAYLIEASPMVGLTGEERRLLARVVRGQRKAFPDRSALAGDFSERDGDRIRKLALLLRLAIAVNKERRDAVERIVCAMDDRGIHVELAGEGDMQLEAWSLNKLSPLCREVFGLPIAAIRLLH